jgi:enoyl-CoA hydratase
VLEVAGRIAMVPAELLQLNKRVVHRQMDAMGMRAGIRAGTELCALGTHTDTMRKFIGAARERGLTNALQERDAPFGDYRTAEPGSS